MMKKVKSYPYPNKIVRKWIRPGLIVIALLIFILIACFRANKTVRNDIISPVDKEIMNLEVGDPFSYGAYEGKPLKWEVLEVNDENVLLLTKDCIAKRAYHSERLDITWEYCALRQWLNDDFYNDAFTNEQKERILKTAIKNPDNAKFGVSGGNDTEDRIFLLGLDEAEQYFSNDNECVATYQGNPTMWWLRSPGWRSYDASVVYERGQIINQGNYVNYGDVGVRPALRLLNNQNVRETTPDKIDIMAISAIAAIVIGLIGLMLHARSNKYAKEANEIAKQKNRD
jgi:hypothetical protein